jgi:hypothetical protein
MSYKGMKTRTKKTILGSKKNLDRSKTEATSLKTGPAGAGDSGKTPRRWSLFKKAYQPGMAICINNPLSLQTT